MYIVAIDLGATYIKGAIIELPSARIVRLVRLPFPGPMDGKAPHVREYDPATVLQRGLTALEELELDEKNIAGLFCSSQMHGTVLIDPTRDALTPFISWQDLRCMLPLAEGGATPFRLVLDAMGSRYKSRYGREYKPGYGLATVFALHCRKEIPSGAIPLSIGDYFLFKLTGAIPHVHETQASGFGGYDIVGHHWDQALFDKLRMPIVLPEIATELEPLGRATLRGVSVVCYPCIGDQQAALKGAGVDSGEIISSNIATGSQVSVLASTNSEGSFQVRPFFGGQYLRTVTHIPAGRAINFLLNQICGFGNNEEALLKAWENAVEEAARLKTTDLVVKLDFFPSEKARCGSVANITELNLTPGNILLAAFKNICEEHYSAALKITSLANKTVLLSGGMAVKSRLLQKMLAERFALPLRLTPHEEDALMGLGQLAKEVLI